MHPVLRYVGITLAMARPNRVLTKRSSCPCLTCSIKITQVGISEVVYSQSYSMDDHTAAVFKEAGINLRQFTPPRNGLVDLEGFRAIHGGHDDAACR